MTTDTKQVDAYFGSKLGGGALARLLQVDQVLARDTALAFVPHAHAILVIANTPEFGGSSDQIAVFSRPTTPVPFTEIALPELGHLAFAPGDEYPTYIGCDKENDPANAGKTHKVFPVNLP